MSKVQMAKDSGRLSARQQRSITRLLSFFRKYAAVLDAAVCSGLLVVSLFLVYGNKINREIEDNDQFLLLQQQQQLKELRDEIYSQSASGERNGAFIRALMEENADTVGWLTIPGTEIDYPVMQTPEDENYYLYRDFYGNENQNGSLLVSAGCDIGNESTNWIIHGHNMKSGAMFGSLTNYRKKSFMKAHNLIFLDTLDGRRTYEVVAVFESQIYYENDYVFKYYQCYDIGDWAEFDSFYSNIKRLSLYDTGINAVFSDHFLTLSTCAYHTENGRFVVVAKELY